jgi:hypothetical protein
MPMDHKRLRPRRAAEVIAVAVLSLWQAEVLNAVWTWSE